MLRSVGVIGLLSAVSMIVPLVYQRNPEAFQRWLAAAVETTSAPTASEPEIETVAAPPSGDTGRPLGRTVRLAANAGGHFVGAFRLNGRSVSAMVDTGATTVAINRSTARSIGIALADSDFRYEVGTANGKTRAAAAIIDRLQIGRIDLDQVRAVVLEDTALQGTLIGMTFLSRLARVQVENGSLLLAQ